jgi:integrase
VSIFRSFLAPQIDAFITYRKASCRWNSTYEVNLKRFDSHCFENFPYAVNLTQELVDSWCGQRESESNGTCRTRIYAVVNLILYLRARGETEIAPPELPRWESPTYIPHAFTDDELKKFFNACDNLPIPRTKHNQAWNLIWPTFFRLLYSSGIRSIEARMLRVENVDLNHGLLDIRYSKGNDQRHVVLHDTMAELMRQYDNAISRFYLNREYFFPSKNGKNYSRHWVAHMFQKLWRKTNNARTVPYDLRHHYAITNINQWICEGFDFDDKLLYLSKSMGHSDVESTKYY